LKSINFKVEEPLKDMNVAQIAAFLQTPYYYSQLVDNKSYAHESFLSGGLRQMQENEPDDENLVVKPPDFMNKS